MAHGGCLVLLPCFTHGETEAHRALWLARVQPGCQGSELAPRPDASTVLGSGLAGTLWVPGQGEPRGRQMEGPWVICQVRACGRWPAGPWRKAARGLHCGSSLFSPLEPCSPQGSGPVASRSLAGQWGFSGKPTTLCLSPQWNNPALTFPLTLPAWLGPSPRHFPKVSVAATRAAPCPWRV